MHYSFCTQNLSFQTCWLAGLFLFQVRLLPGATALSLYSLFSEFILFQVSSFGSIQRLFICRLISAPITKISIRPRTLMKKTYMAGKKKKNWKEEKGFLQPQLILLPSLQQHLWGQLYEVQINSRASGSHGDGGMWEFSQTHTGDASWSQNWQTMRKAFGVWGFEGLDDGQLRNSTKIHCYFFRLLECVDDAHVWVRMWKVWVKE